MRDDFMVDSETGILQVHDTNDCATNHCVRVYKCSPRYAAIQVRSHAGEHGEGKRFMIAHASLSLRELWTFRDHINTVLEEMQR